MAVIGGAVFGGGVLLCDKGTISERGKGKKGLFSAFYGVGAMPNTGQGAKMRFRGVFWREKGKGCAALCVAWRVGGAWGRGAGCAHPYSGACARGAVLPLC